MAHVSYSKVLAATPASVWEVVRDFGALPRWFPFVVRTQMRGGGPQTVGAIRTNTLNTGSVIEERLSELSERDRRIVYELISGDVPTKNYSATLRIHEVAADPTRCFAEWSADFDVDGDRTPVEAWVRDGIFKTCLEALERLTGAHAVATDSENTAEGNRKIVRAAFEAWAAGSSDFSELLADDAVWRITGSGHSAQTFEGRQAFLDGAYHPIAQTFAAPMKPQVLGLFADGDEVVVRWDGEAAMEDGQTYRNSYAWFFRMREGKVVRAAAFLDLPTYDAALAGTSLPDWPTS